MVKTAVSLMWLLMLASSAAAQIKPGAPVFVVDLFDPRLRSVVVSASSFNDALADTGALAPPVERVVDACKSGQGQAVVKKLFDCIDCLAGYQEARFVSDRGDQALLIVLYDAAKTRREDIRPYFQETPRDSELFATGKALTELLRAEAAGDLKCEAFLYTLQRRRSKLKVVVPVPGAAERADASAAPRPNPLIAPAAGPTPGRAGPSAEVRSPDVTLGPIEHWFFSADFSIAAASVKLGATPTPDAEQLKGKHFFVALNFALGDLLSDREARLQRRGWLQEIVIKVQATPSQEPWSAWGVGVGLRGYRIKTILWNMDVVHPYVAFSRQTAEDGERRWHAIFGLGFDPRAINRQE